MHVNYRTGLVVFLDILGFKNLIKKSGNNATVPMEAVRRLREHWDGRPYDKAIGVTFHAFGDSIVIVVPTDGKGSDSSYRWFGDVVRRVGECQLELLKPEPTLLIRGGVAEGLVYSDSGQQVVLGPAVNQAYRLASEQAFVPRVAVDEPCIPKQWVEAWRSAQKREGEYAPVICLRDGVWFVDYLRGSLRYLSGRLPQAWEETQRQEWQERLSLLRNHKEAVLSYAANVGEWHPVEMARCAWLSWYHNLHVQFSMPRTRASQAEIEMCASLEDWLVGEDEFAGKLLRLPESEGAT